MPFGDSVDLEVLYNSELAFPDRLRFLDVRLEGFALLNAGKNKERDIAVGNFAGISG